MENKKRTAYIVVTEWVHSGENDVDFSDIFTSRDRAVQFFDIAVAYERARKEKYGYDEEKMSEDGSEFYLWEEGCFSENHVRIQLKEQPLHTSGWN